MATEGSHERGTLGRKTVAVLLGALALYVLGAVIYAWLWSLVSEHTFGWDDLVLAAFSVVLVWCAVRCARAAVLLWAGASGEGIRGLAFIFGATCCVLVLLGHEMASPLLSESLPFLRESTWRSLFGLLGFAAGIVAYHLCRTWCTALAGMPEAATRAANTRSARTVMQLFCLLLFSAMSSVMMDVWPKAPGHEYVLESPGELVSFLGSIALAIVVYKVSVRIIDRRAGKTGEPIAPTEQAAG